MADRDPVNAAPPEPPGGDPGSKALLETGPKAWVPPPAPPSPDASPDPPATGPDGQPLSPRIRSSAEGPRSTERLMAVATLLAVFAAIGAVAVVQVRDWKGLSLGKAAPAPASTRVPQGIRGLRFGMAFYDVKNRIDPAEELQPVVAIVGGGEYPEVGIPGEHSLWTTTLEGDVAECILSYQDDHGLQAMRCGIYDLPTPELLLAREDTLLRNLERAYGLPDAQSHPVADDGAITLDPTRTRHRSWTWEGPKSVLRFRSTWSHGEDGTLTSELVVENVSSDYRAFLRGLATEHGLPPEVAP